MLPRRASDWYTISVVLAGVAVQGYGLLGGRHWLIALAILLLGLRWLGLAQHNHLHTPIFRAWLPCRLVEHTFTLSMGVPTSLYSIHHIAVHHKYDCGEGDWTGEFATGWPSQRSSATFARYVVTFIPRAARRCPHLLWTEHPSKRRRLVGECLALLASLTALFLWSSPSRIALFLLIPWLATYVFLPIANWRQHAFLDHAAAETSAQLRLNPMSKGFLNFHIGYHAAHHAAPGVHWSRIPRLHLERVASPNTSQT